MQLPWLLRDTPMLFVLCNLTRLNVTARPHRAGSLVLQARGPGAATWWWRCPAAAAAAGGTVHTHGLLGRRAGPRLVMQLQVHALMAVHTAGYCSMMCASAWLRRALCGLLTPGQ